MLEEFGQKEHKHSNIHIAIISTDISIAIRLTIISIDNFYITILVLTEKKKNCRHFIKLLLINVVNWKDLKLHLTKKLNCT